MHNVSYCMRVGDGVTGGGGVGGRQGVVEESDVGSFVTATRCKLKDRWLFHPFSPFNCIILVLKACHLPLYSPRPPPQPRAPS